MLQDLKQKYISEPDSFYQFIIDLLKGLLNKYSFSDQIYSTSDLSYLNDLQLLRLLDTTFDKEMSDTIKLDLYIQSLKDLKVFENKYNILLLQFCPNPNKLAKVIEDVHLYLTLLQEEKNLRNGKDFYDQIKSNLESL